MSDTPQSFADRLYPTTATAPVAAPAPIAATPVVQSATPAPAAPPVSQGQPGPASDRLYPAPGAQEPEVLPPGIAELRQAPERRLYDPERTYASSGIAGLFEGQPNARAETRSWSNILADLEASPQEATTMTALVRAARSNLPDDATVAAWGNQAMTQVRQQYGDRADAMLADARRLVARDPRVAALLQQSGLGNHPRVIAIAIEKAAALRSAGRLR